MKHLIRTKAEEFVFFFSSESIQNMGPNQKDWNCAQTENGLLFGGVPINIYFVQL